MVQHPPNEKYEKREKKKKKEANISPQIHVCSVLWYNVSGDVVQKKRKTHDSGAQPYNIPQNEVFRF